MTFIAIVFPKKPKRPFPDYYQENKNWINLSDKFIYYFVNPHTSNRSIRKKEVI